MNKTLRLIVLGLFVAQSLVLYIIEGMLPVPFIAPGAKLGLANLITVIALYSSCAFSCLQPLAVVLMHFSTAYPVQP